MVQVGQIILKGSSEWSVVLEVLSLDGLGPWFYGHRNQPEGLRWVLRYAWQGRDRQDVDWNRWRRSSSRRQGSTSFASTWYHRRVGDNLEDLEKKERRRHKRDILRMYRKTHPRWDRADRKGSRMIERIVVVVVVVVDHHFYDEGCIRGQWVEVILEETFVAAILWVAVERIWWWGQCQKWSWLLNLRGHHSWTPKWHPWFWTPTGQWCRWAWHRWCAGAWGSRAVGPRLRCSVDYTLVTTGVSTRAADCTKDSPTQSSQSSNPHKTRKPHYPYLYFCM